MAGDAVDQRGGLPAAEIEGQRAARIERAARRRIDRVGDLALDRNPLPAGHGEIRHRAQQHPGVGHARIVEEFAPLGDLDDAAEIHHADAVGHVPDDGEVVADEEIGEAELVLQVAHQIEDLRLHRDVERRSRLVADDELGLGGERARDRDPLPLAAGKLVRIFQTVVGVQSDQIQQFAHPAHDVALAFDKIEGADRLGDDGVHPQPRVEARIGILKDHLDAAAQVLARLRLASRRSWKYRR